MALQNIRYWTRRLTPDVVKFQAKRILRGGGTERCPLCESSFKSYLQKGEPFELFERRNVVGAGPREFDACPICGGRDRGRLMQLFLDKHVFQSGADFRVLHIAPEYGLSRWLRKQRDCADYVAADLEPHVHIGVPNVQKADLLGLPFEDQSFDVVICSHVLEHVQDDGKAMRELYRVLAPGGVGLLQVPYANDGGETDEDPSVTDVGERVRRFGQGDHVRLYALDDFVERLKSAGFSVEVFDPYEAFPEEAALRRLNRSEFLPVGRRAER